MMPNSRRVWKRRSLVAAVVVSTATVVAAVTLVSKNRTIPIASAPVQEIAVPIIEPQEEPVAEAKRHELAPQRLAVEFSPKKDMAEKPVFEQASMAEDNRSEDMMQAPIQLAMLKVGMQSSKSLKRAQDLQFDDSEVRLASAGSADAILAATERATVHTRPGQRPIVFRGGGKGGPVCK